MTTQDTQARRAPGRRRTGVARTTALVAAGMLALSACADAGPGDGGGAATTGAASAGTSAATGTGSATAGSDPAASGAATTTARRTGPPPATVTLALAGDANTAWTARRVLTDGVGRMSPVLAEADIAALTLETLVVPDDSGLVAEDKAFTFKTRPAFLDRLADAGVDVTNAANNHTMDYGVEGMRRMLTLRSPVGIVGIGADPDAAFKPWERTVRGRRVVVFGGNDVETDGLTWSAAPGRPGQAVIMHPEGQARLVADVRAARDADPDAVVVVLLHWGREPETCQSPRQEELARAFAEAGADVVAGSHSHRQMPYTTIPGRDGRTTAVAYGLGNFVFNAPSEGSATTGVLTLTVPGQGAPTAVWHPARISDGLPRPLTGDAAERAKEAWAGGPARCA